MKTIRFALDNKDDILMRLVHYFITEANYSPIIVNGVRDEIWLQNQEGPFKIIRINANYIHNREQYEFDLLKLRNVMKQVKRKTLSWTMNALNILIDVNEDVELEETKNIKTVHIKTVKDISKNKVDEIFPDIHDKLLLDEKDLDLIMDVTKNINEKNDKENRMYEKLFRPKKTLITNLLIFINVLLFLFTYIFSNGTLSGYDLLRFGALNSVLVRQGEIWRLITAGFLHGGLLHLLFNMYALYIIGNQVENIVGSLRFIVLYVGSLVASSLMSCVINPNTISVGASGAIFGLLGAILYFGFRYRLYLSSVLRNQIIPVIILNLLLGFIMTGVDNAAHIGGMVGGLLLAMALGVQKKEAKQEKINGWITYLFYISFLVYICFRY